MKNYRIYLLILFLPWMIALPQSLPAQGVIITPGATCKTTGAASIILHDANLINNGSFLASAGSTVELNGSSGQSIGGSSSITFENLALDNANGLTLTNSETVNGTLTLTNGKITLGANNLVMGTAAVFSGASGSNYVVTNSTGALRQHVTNNATDVTYPVGLATGYLPVTVQLTVGSTADVISARVANGLYTAYDEGDVPTGSLLTGNVVSKTWVIDELVTGASNATVKLQWNAADETSGFTRSNCNEAQYTGAAWVYSTNSAAAGSGPYSQMISGITSFSPLGIFSPYIHCSVTTGPYCVGSPVSIDYTLGGGAWNSGNTFTAQLSDNTGSFTFPADIGTNVSQASGTISASVPVSSTEGTAYRVRVNSSNPALTGENNGADITINELRDITGNINYYNTANTLLTTGVKVKLYQDGNQVGQEYTVTDGTYAFNDLCPGNYEVRVTSTRSTAGSVNTTDAAQVNFWGANPYSIEKVRFYAGDVTGEPFFINSSDAQLIKANFVYGTPFDKGAAWTFWKAGQTIGSNSNPTESYPSVNLAAGSNASANIYGLCTGDFNRSFTASAKAGSTDLALVCEGNITIGKDTEFDLPLNLMEASGIGAVSLILNFPDELVSILDVSMDDAGSGINWSVDGNELRIGWYSQNPSFLEANDELLYMHLKTTTAFTSGNSVRFTLADNPLNELADERYEVVNHATLSLASIEASAFGLDEPGKANPVSFRNYPNPFFETTTFSYTLPADGRVTLEICDLMGNPIAVLLNENQQAGEHTLAFNPEQFIPGVYMARLQLICKSDTKTSIIKMVKSW